MNLDFRGEVAVVTGDARGIGEATAKKTCSFRASVVILDVVISATAFASYRRGSRTISDDRHTGEQRRTTALDLPKALIANPERAEMH